MAKTVKVSITDNGLEETFNLDPKTDPNFDDTLGELLCEVFDSPAVKFHIEVLDYTDAEENE